MCIYIFVIFLKYIKPRLTWIQRKNTLVVLLFFFFLPFFKNITNHICIKYFDRIEKKMIKRVISFTNVFITGNLHTILNDWYMFQYIFLFKRTKKQNKKKTYYKIIRWKFVHIIYYNVNKHNSIRPCTCIYSGY